MNVRPMNVRVEISEDARTHLLRELELFRGRRPVVAVSWQPASAELSRTPSGGTNLVRWPASGHIVVAVAPPDLDPSWITDVLGIPVWLRGADFPNGPRFLRLEVEGGAIVVRSRGD